MPIVQPINEPFKFTKGDSFPSFSFKIISETGVVSLSGSTIELIISNLSYIKIVIPTITDDIAEFNWDQIVEDIPANIYVYKIRVQLSDGFIQTIFNGQFTVTN